MEARGAGTSSGGGLGALGIVEHQLGKHDTFVFQTAIPQCKERSRRLGIGVDASQVCTKQNGNKNGTLWQGMFVYSSTAR